jgi:hypothetical protein
MVTRAWSEAGSQTDPSSPRSGRGRYSSVPAMITLATVK